MTQTTYKSGPNCGQTGLTSEKTVGKSVLTASLYEKLSMASMANSQETTSPMPSIQYSHGPGVLCHPSTYRAARKFITDQDRFPGFFRDTRRGTDSEIIRRMERRIDELESEVTFLRTHDSSPVVHCIEIVDTSYDEVKSKVLDYYLSHGVNYPDDIAIDLKMDLKTVMKAVDELIAEGKLETAV